MENRNAILGRRIRTLRMKNSLAQTELAKRIGVSQSHLSNMEKGTSNVTMETLFALRDAFDVKFADFFVDFDYAQDHKKLDDKMPADSFWRNLNSDEVITISDILEAVMYIKEKKSRK